MKCPLNGRRGWIHAYEHGDLSEDRGGAGDEVTGSVVTSHIGQDQVVAGTFGNRDEDVLSSIAARLARLDRELTPNDRTALVETANGQTLAAIAGDIVSALDPDRHVEAARCAAGTVKRRLNSAM